jgi:hypothetical protein
MIVLNIIAKIYFFVKLNKEISIINKISISIYVFHYFFCTLELMDYITFVIIDHWD